METLSEDMLWLLEARKASLGQEAQPLPIKNERRLTGLGWIRMRNGIWVPTLQGEQELARRGLV